MWEMQLQNGAKKHLVVGALLEASAAISPGGAWLGPVPDSYSYTLLSSALSC